MINYEKKTINGNDTIVLNTNNSKLKLCAEENAIEWIFTGNNGNNCFIITMDDYEIYETFLNLYSSISTGNIFYEDDLYDNSENFLYETSFCNFATELKNTDKYKKLFNNGIISYTSDSLFKDLADTVNISKGEDYFILEFKGKKPSNSRIIKFDIDFNNYFSLTKPFIKHYDEIKSIDLSYHQISFYDIVKNKNI